MKNCSSTSNPRPVLILGIGNPYCGNDAIGPEVINRLRELDVFSPDSVELAVVSEGPQGWIQVLEGRSRAIIVDAVSGTGEPMGAVVKWIFSPYDKTDLLDCAGSHSHNLKEILRVFADSGFDLPQYLALVGIEVGEGEIGFGDKMTPEIFNVMETMAKTIISMAQNDFKP